MGQTSSSCARRRMLRPLRPPRSISSSATRRMRSRDSVWVSAPLLICTVYSTVYSGEGEAVPSRSTARALVWGALAGQLAFIAAWVVAGALEPGYSHVDQGVSELGAATASHPLVMDAGLVVLGASLAALGVALLPALPRRRAAWGPAGLFVATGVAMALAGVFRLDCGPAVDAHCRALWRAGELSWHQDAHVLSGLAADLLLMATPFAIAAALWPAPSGVAALGAGVSGLLIGALTIFGPAGGDGGLVQRLGLGVLHLWVVIVAIGVLHVLRRAPRYSELIPRRPRDFLARSWRGRGELTPWPYVLGRRLARSFEARREATW